MSILHGVKQTIQWRTLDDGLEVLIDVRCGLGEGIFFGANEHVACWFDIDQNCYFMLEDSTLTTWRLPFTATAGYHQDSNIFVVATEDGLKKFEVAGEALSYSTLRDISLSNSFRTNDGRADPLGGFWFSSMPREVGINTGSIFRYSNNELRTIASGLKIPNSICVHPSGSFALFSDTALQLIYSIALDNEGWPIGSVETAIDLTGTDCFPDGAFFDSRGRLYVAMWGTGRVAIFGSDFQEIRSLSLPTPYVTCPALDPHDPAMLWVTSATSPDSSGYDYSGKIFKIRAN